MAIELLILGVGLYLGVYLSQQLSAGLPEMPSPAAAAGALALRMRDMFRTLSGVVSDEPQQATLTGEIPPDLMPPDDLAIEQIVAEQLSPDTKGAP